MGRNILFTYVSNTDVSDFINDHLNNTEDIYSKRIAFLGETGLIMTHGELFAYSKSDLSADYEMSELLNSSLHLMPGDSFETAFGKLEKIIVDDEESIANALNYLNDNKLDSSEISIVGLSNDYNDLDNLPVIPSIDNLPTKEYVDSSINTLKDYIDSSINTLKEYVDSSLVLSSSYIMSSSINDELYLTPGDSFETAFSKVEKAIVDNEQALVNALIYLDDNKLNSSEISTVGLSNDYNDLDNLPTIPSLDDVPTKEYVDNSINTLKEYVDSSLVLSSSYIMSSSLNDELYLTPGDSFETAFGKLEKAIVDNEQISANSLIYLNENKLDISAVNDFVTKEYVDSSFNNLINDINNSEFVIL